MAIYLERDLMWVVIEDGRMFIHYPNGERIIGEIFCRVEDKNGELPKAIFRTLVNIAGSKEEMMIKIKEANEKYPVQ